MSLGKCSIRADFLAHSGGRLFYLLLEPSDLAPSSTILFLHPFADEMHKSRHIVASQARALATAGHRVMLLDLSGCGDSTGEFVEASWDTWLHDAASALEMLGGIDGTPVSVWGLRLGGLLACDLSRGRADISRLILWQPVLNGEQQIDQFLRLHSARIALDQHSTFDRKALWQSLRSGKSLEIAGFELSSGMALQIAKVRLQECQPACPVIWVNIGSGANSTLSVASQGVIASWRERAVDVQNRHVQGEPFWRSIDARVNLRLQQATVDLQADHA